MPTKKELEDRLQELESEYEELRQASTIISGCTFMGSPTDKHCKAVIEIAKALRETAKSLNQKAPLLNIK